MYDTLIIGAGMSGIAAGIRLAHFDQRVCICERHTTIGGLNSFYRLRGRDYDVGLHAVTNFTPKGTRRGPLARLLKQLRLRWEDLDLSPQRESAVAFPQARLRFNNDPRLLEEEIAAAFPGEVDNFRRLAAQIVDYDDLRPELMEISARQVLTETFNSPLLAEMLLCPLAWYGNARERDMDFLQFCIMFRSIYLEGFARPLEGIRRLLRLLIKKFRGLGGELRLRSGVRRILVEHGRACGVELDDGTQLAAERVVSSAGYPETMRLAGADQDLAPDDVGQLSFCETLSVLDALPEEIGYPETILFFNDSEQFHWERPREALCDVRTGVVCSPNNYDYGLAAPANGRLPEGVIRTTALASYDRWTGLEEADYRREKARWYERMVASAVRFIPDFRDRVIETDMFTPRTIHRFTWHENGTVYGAPRKRLDGATHVPNLFLCGTDTGMVGIIGTIISGITVANRHCLTT